MDQGLNDSIKVVVRSVRERTEAECVAAISAQGIAHDDIELVNEAPFVKALRSSFEVGLESGREWTLCIDADVILRPNSISALLVHAQRAHEKTCEVQGLMLDKFTVSIRAGGVHLYRTALLEKAIRKIPSVEDAIRPETHVLHEMDRDGYPWVTVPYVIGIHDFGQYFEDIFRKCYVHAHKHLLHIPELLPNWRRRAETDADFEVAIEGLIYGLRENSAIHIDKRLTSVSSAFTQLGFAEKGAAAPKSITPLVVENKLSEWAAEDVPVHGFSVTAGEAVNFGPDTHLTLAGRTVGGLQRKVREIGFVRTVPFALGSGIERLGSLIKRFSYERKGRS